MKTYWSKGIIVFPAQAAIVPFMAKLRLIFGDSQIYEMTKRFKIATMEVDVGHTMLNLYVMFVIDKNRNAHDISDTPTYRLFEQAIEFGLVSKMYWQDISSYNEETTCHYCMYPQGLEELMQSLGLDSVVASSLVGAAMQGIIEDTNMEMQVYFGSGDGHIESELHEDVFVYNYLTRQEEKANESDN